VLFLNSRLLLCLTQQEHAANLLRADLLFQACRNLLERKSEILEREDAMKLRELGCGVVAVTGLRIDVHGR
jgi:hypothetical protein